MNPIETHLTEYRKRLEQHKATIARLEAQLQATGAQVNATMGAIQALERLQADAAKAPAPDVPNAENVS